jgi:hypothetical protein
MGVENDELAELRQNLAEYQEQLQQLEELLLDEPENSDYQSLYHDVQEVRFAACLPEVASTQSASLHHGACARARVVRGICQFKVHRLVTRGMCMLVMDARP